MASGNAVPVRHDDRDLVLGGEREGEIVASTLKSVID
jgi:hypothetical protein